MAPLGARSGPACRPCPILEVSWARPGREGPGDPTPPPPAFTFTGRPGRLICPRRPALSKALLGHRLAAALEDGSGARELSRPEAGAGLPTFQGRGRGRASGCGGGHLEGWGALFKAWPGTPQPAPGRGRGWDRSRDWTGPLTWQTEQVAARALALAKEGGGCSNVASLMCKKQDPEENQGY